MNSIATSSFLAPRSAMRSPRTQAAVFNFVCPEPLCAGLAGGKMMRKFVSPVAGRE